MWGDLSVTALRSDFPNSGLIVLAFTESNVLSMNRQNLAVPTALASKLPLGAKKV